MKILDIKKWIKLKNNAQFMVVDNYFGTPTIVKRLYDGKFFVIGYIPCAKNNWYYVMIKKFCEDLMHVEGRIYFTLDSGYINNGYINFSAEINDINIKGNKIIDMTYKIMT